MTFHVIAIFLFFMVIFLVQPFYSTEYFRFGPPFVVENVRVTSWLTWTALVLCLMASRFICDLSEACFAVVTPSTAADIPVYVFVLRDGIVLAAEFLRILLNFFLINSQVSFVVLVAAVDVPLRHFMHEEAERLAPRWRGMHNRFILLVALEVLCLSLGVVVLDLQRSSYMNVGPPIAPFSILLDTDLQYFAVILFVFCEQFFARYTETVTSQWRKEILLGSKVKAAEEFQTTRMGAYAIVFISQSYAWLRYMFIINFMFQQFFFVLIYYLAAYFSSMTLRLWTFSFWKMKYILVLQMFEIIIITLFVVFFAPWGDAYFSWPPPLVIFDLEVTSQTPVTLLLLFVVFLRIGGTLHEQIAEVDIGNGVMHNHKNNSGIEDSEDTETSSDYVSLYIVVTTVHFWLNNMILMQFILQNVSFVVICAVVDLLLLLFVCSDAVNRLNYRIVAHVKETFMRENRFDFRKNEMQARQEAKKK